MLSPDIANITAMAPPFDSLLSLSEAAQIWDIHESALRRAILDGKFGPPGYSCRKFGKQWVITIDAAIQYAATHGRYKSLAAAQAKWADYVDQMQLRGT